MSRKNYWNIGATLILISMISFSVALSLGFLQQTVREFVLRFALDRIATGLPARLEIEEALWPDPGTITFEGISLRSGSETLAAADYVEISVRLSSLLQRDLHIRSIEVAEIFLDLPGIRTAFPSKIEEESSNRTGFSPLRSGAIASLPSVVVEELTLTGRRMVIAAGREAADFRIVASANNRPDQIPELLIKELCIRDPDHVWQVEKMEAVARRGIPLQANILIGIAPENRMSLDIREESSSSYRLTLREPGTAPVAAALVEGIVELGAMNDTLPIRFTLSGHVPETKRLHGYAPAADYLKNVPTVGATPFDIDGHHYAQSGSGELSLRLGSNGWIDGARARLRWGEDRIDADSVNVQIDDLLAEGAFSVFAGEAVGTCRIEMRGSSWLSHHLPPSADPPPHVRGELFLETAGKIDSLNSSALMVISEIESAPLIRGLRVEATHSSSDGVIHTTVEAKTDMICADFAAIVDAGLSEILIGPIRLLETESPHPAPPRIGAAPGTIRINRRAGGARLSAVRLTGDYGRGSISGNISRNGGDIRLDASWNSPPTALLRRIEPASREILRERWSSTPPYRIDGNLSFGELKTGVDAAAQLSFDIPGLSILSPALPPEASRRLTGELAIDASALTGDRHIIGSLNMRPEGWIDSVAAHGFVNGETYGIDSATIALRGLRLQGEGTAVRDSIRIHSFYEIETKAIRSLLPENSPVDSLRATGEVLISGSPASPESWLSFRGNIRGATFVAESLEGEANMANGFIEGTIQVGDRSLAGPVRMTNATAAWRGPSAPPYLPASIVIEGNGPDLDFVFDSELNRVDDALLVRGNTLKLALQDRTLKASNPFDVWFDPAARKLGIQGLDLAGTMGTIKTDGTAGPDSANLTLHAALEIPRRPFAFDIPECSLPERVEIDAIASGRDELIVTATADGVDIGPRKGIEVRLDLEGSAGGLSAHIAAEDPTGSLLQADASLPLSARFFPPGAGSMAGTLHVDANFDRLPLPLTNGRGGPAGWAEMDGRLSASGTASKPVLEGSATVGFPSLAGLADYQILFDTRYLAEGGIVMDLDVTQDGEQIAEASLQDPTSISLHPFEVVRDTSGAFFLDLRTKELRLHDFNQWFPSGSSIDGDVSIELAAKGHVGNPNLRGKIASRKVSLKLSDRSRVNARGEMRLAGSVRNPEIRGEAIIDNGELRLPEDHKHLLPNDGIAMLWEVPEFTDTDRFATDSIPHADTATDLPTAVDPDMEVTLLIPSGLWIRGQGLDVELSGELSLAYRELRPSITGELAATRGHFIFLGRTFRMDSGTITFYGEEEINPAMEINLTINLEGTIVRVSVGGTLLDPQLGFSSEPAMAEGDIMSFLLFGRPLEDLSNNQMDLIQRRATDIVTTFGSAQLEAKLAGQLGVDMVRIRDTRGDKKGNSLVLGKYVNRKVLVEYEQALERSLFFISLDYFLTRHFRLKTLYGQGDQSGMEMNWFNDY